MKVYNIVSLILLLSFSVASVVQEINIIGNHHTKEHIIMREIHHPMPGEYDFILAEKLISSNF